MKQVEFSSVFAGCELCSGRSQVHEKNPAAKQVRYIFTHLGVSGKPCEFAECLSQCTNRGGHVECMGQ